MDEILASLETTEQAEDYTRILIERLNTIMGGKRQFRLLKLREDGYMLYLGEKAISGHPYLDLRDSINWLRCANIVAEAIKS